MPNRQNSHIIPYLAAAVILHVREQPLGKLLGAPSHPKRPPDAPFAEEL